MDTIKDALIFAYEKHKNQTRKGTSIPYFVHILDVASILIKNGASKKVVAAGVLHDIVEDREFTHVTETQIRKIFGSEIADLVMNVTERDKSLPWKVRKKAAIDHLKSASRDVQMIKCADKLSNIRDMKTDYGLHGDKMWGRFNAPKNDVAWSYREVMKNLKKIRDTAMYLEYKECVEDIFGSGRK